MTGLRQRWFDMREDWPDRRFVWEVRSNLWSQAVMRGRLRASALDRLRRRARGARVAAFLLGKATDPAAAEPLVAAMTVGDRRLKRIAARRLARWLAWDGHGAAWRPFPPGASGQGHVVGALSDPDLDVRVAASLVLGASRTPEAVAPLAGVIQDETEDEMVRQHALTAISRLPREAALPVLNDAISTVRTGSVRSQLALVIGNDMTPEAKRRLVELMDAEALRRARA